jgi:microcystin-dependent protein
MPDPTTPLGALIVPNTGADVGTWGSVAMNPNFVAIDAVQRGVQSISLSAATTFTLSAPSGTITPGAGPNQAQNAILKFSGALAGNGLVTLPLPGYYIMRNGCTNNAAFYIQVRAVGSGNIVALPPGRAVHIWCDGTDVDFVNAPEVGSYLDLATDNFHINYPVWMQACSVLPYLLCDGTIYSVATYPFLGERLGGTFGGNGSTTFAVPDLRARYRIPYAGGTGRISTAGSGIDGTTIGSSGGAQSQFVLQANLPNPVLNVTISDTRVWSLSTSGQQVAITGAGSLFGGGAAGGGASPVVSVTSGSISGSTTLGGSNTPLITVPPGMVSGITLIKT